MLSSQQSPVRQWTEDRSRTTPPASATADASAPLETDVIGFKTIDVWGNTLFQSCGYRHATLRSGASSPVRNCARPFPKDQSSSEFVTIDTTTSDGGMPHVDSNSRQSRL
jgi:hypothetical protein